MAMAVQQKTQQGDLAAMAAAMTPGAGAMTVAAVHPRPTVSGQTPNAKKPVTKSTIAIAQGGNRPMTMDEVVTGFNHLSGLQQRQDVYDEDVAKCIDWNAVLLNALVSRVNTLEINAAPQQAAIDSQNQKIETLTEGVKRALGQVEEADAAKDWVLRGELSAMMVKLESANTELTTKMQQLEAVVMAMPTAAPPPDKATTPGRPPPP